MVLQSFYPMVRGVISVLAGFLLGVLGCFKSPPSTTPFYLDDGTGRILVDPAGCKVDSRKLLFDINLHHAILGSHTSERGFPESRLMPGDEIYVLGNLQIND